MSRRVATAVAGLTVVCVFAASGCGLISGEETRTSKKSGLEIQNASGRIQSVDAGEDRFSLKPESGDRMIFRVGDNSAITVGGENAGLDEIRKGQRGTVSYVVRGDDRNIVRVLNLRSSEGQGEDSGDSQPAPTTSEETTG